MKQFLKNEYVTTSLGYVQCLLSNLVENDYDLLQGTYNISVILNLIKMIYWLFSS